MRISPTECPFHGGTKLVALCIIVCNRQIIITIFIHTINMYTDALEKQIKRQFKQMSLIIRVISLCRSSQCDILSLTRESSFNTLAKLLLSFDLHCISHWFLNSFITSVIVLSFRQSYATPSDWQSLFMLLPKMHLLFVMYLTMQLMVSHSLWTAQSANLANLAKNMWTSQKPSNKQHNKV